MKRNFDNWFSKFRNSIANYEYYIDFDTVYSNISSLEINLNILNTLIGKKDVENKFKDLVKKYPEVLSCIPILLAKRENEIFCMDENGPVNYQFLKNTNTIEDYVYFMNHTGLFDLISNHIINNLVDYVLGVEVGLNSNARKNRGGHLMEYLVEKYIVEAGYKKDKTYFKEIKTSKIEADFNIDLSALSNNGKTVKRFDYAIIENDTVYAIECNFYATQGSKLNETARSYKNITLEAKNISNFKFMWITDGQGWKYAKHNLEETFDCLDDMYNIDDLENGILKKLSK